MRRHAFRTASLRAVSGLAVLGAAAALAVAYGLEAWGGLVPCALCLLERWPYRIVIVLGLLAALTPSGLSRALLALAVVCLLADVGISGAHVGVELGWWPSPLPECAAPRLGSGSIAQRFAALPERPAKPCDDPTYLIPALPLSVAAMNLLYALAFSVVVALSVRDRQRRR